MGHHHSHEHCDHNHHHGHHHHEGNRKGLFAAFVISIMIVGLEIWGGLKSHSISLLSDSVHMITDVLALSISLLANLLSREQNRNADELSKWEVGATIFNAMTLVITPIWIVWEAVQRFLYPPEIQGGLMIGVAVMGLCANLLSAWIMTKTADVKDNLNVRGAYLHVLTDAWGSAGVIVSGFLIAGFGFVWADPIISLIMAVLIAKGGLGILRGVYHMRETRKALN